jgi:hypothetical protein
MVVSQFRDKDDLMQGDCTLSAVVYEGCGRGAIHGAALNRSWTKGGAVIDHTGIGVADVSRSPPLARADEGGLSFWLPGLFGSFAAAPAEPGLSIATFYYHSSVGTSGGKTFVQGGRIEAGLQGRGDLFGIGPTYTFETPVLGGQAAVSILGVGGRSWGAVDATLAGPRGNAISGERNQSLTSIGDLFPQATLKWNQGVNNFMIYGTGDIPVGDYDKRRLVNLGLGHGSIDGGFGYTYFNPAKRLEFSATPGLTYNFVNPSTQYQNGIDMHLDFGASYFLTEHLNVGPVAYIFQQITGDHGAGATLGSFESRVAGAGPQLNYFFPLGEKIQAVISIKAYKEFATQNRPEGWNAWFTIAFSPASPKQTAAQ